MKKSILAIACLAASLSTFAQGLGGKSKPLLFQASKNNVQVLPQRFEYTLLDEDRFKIGDILIDTTQITFELEPSPQKNGLYQIRFTWPADLIREGVLTLKNNSGKAIFSTTLTKENFKLSHEKLTPNEEGLRAEIGSLTIENAPSDLIDSLKYLPFIEFCLFRESDETRLYLCSKELYVSSQEGPLKVKARSSNKKSSQIEVNGKIVGNQGLIYLNDITENVAFKARTQSGAFLEIETRMKAVDFKDIVVSNDNEYLILTADGARPVDESIIKKLSEQDWQIPLPLNRPVLYLRGDGDIPMRQEFFVRGALPQEKNRVFLAPQSIERTYSSSLTFNGSKPEDIEVSTPPEDEKSSVKVLKKNQFAWTVTDIPKGKSSRHYLTVTSGDKKFSAGYDVLRGEPFGLGLSAQYFTPAGVAFGSATFQWWFEKFLTLKPKWANFHWGLGLERQQQVLETENTTTLHLTTIELLWRAHEGFNFIDDTWGLSVPLQNIESPLSSTMTYGVGAFLSKKPPRLLKSLMHWSELKLQYFMSSSGGDLPLSSALKADAYAFWALSQQWHLRYGVDLMQYQFDSANAKSEVQVGLNAGVFWKF